MADPNALALNNNANSRSPPPQTQQAHLHTATASIFTRRPSFFGGRSKRSKSSNPPPSRTVTPPVSDPPPPGQHTAHVAPPLVPNQYDQPPKVPTTPPRRKHASRHSFSSSASDIGTTLRRSRSASLRTNTSSAGTSASSHKRNPSATLALSFSPEKASSANAAAAATASRPALSISTFSRNKQKSTENVKPGEGGGGQGYSKSPLSAVDNPKTPFGMAVPLRYPPSQAEIKQAQRHQGSYGSGFNGGLAPAPQISSLSAGAHNPNIIFQHIHEMASKRISTLDYLRKAHEGRIYWFNTLLFAKSDLTRLPSFTPRNLSRRATNYLLLGFSLPTILDLNSNSPTDYLKALNALLLEFEQYQQIHPPDGSTSSSLGRGKMTQMFKRNLGVGGKGRRSSSATTDFPALVNQSSFGSNGSGAGEDGHMGADAYSASSPPDMDLLLPNESYTYLQTPSIPFDPDFFSTFATLCDVLIDCYTKILGLLNTPDALVSAGGGVPSTVGDLFSKADARVRKIILAGVVREFEENCRQGVRGEVGGVGKVVLGGLM
ncbi:hypothetical protein BCR34DRAFT_490796 [Clohesyomyces aquaticus]|uniref:Uncharacterized protein n=1 Tax=Clohesyomyces aquaticus TaxID=1231657 RepID=A0A1Y1Z5P0_9PLEO|nr:hypothetical protein BCR34DRAFT_490796 [Clohesyomyces aquaticus]